MTELTQAENDGLGKQKQEQDQAKQDPDWAAQEQAARAMIEKGVTDLLDAYWSFGCDCRGGAENVVDDVNRILYGTHGYGYFGGLAEFLSYHYAAKVTCWQEGKPKPITIYREFAGSPRFRLPDGSVVRIPASVTITISPRSAPEPVSAAEAASVLEQQEFEAALPQEPLGGGKGKLVTWMDVPYDVDPDSGNSLTEGPPSDGSPPESPPDLRKPSPGATP